MIPSIGQPPPPPVTEASRRRRAFTLVELLVVVGIMGLMLALTVAAFEGIGKGSRMRAALTELKTSLSLARQYAITDRTIVFVVFPDELVDFSGTPGLGPTRYSSYFLCNTSRWARMLGQWHHLPKGIVFDRTATPPPMLIGLNYGNVYDRSVSNNVAVIPFPIETSNIVDQAVCALKFHPNGRLQQTGGTTPVVFVTEGSALSDLTTGNLNDYFIQPNAVRYMIEIRPLTGRAKITEM